MSEKKTNKMIRYIFVNPSFIFGNYETLKFCLRTTNLGLLNYADYLVFLNKYLFIKMTIASLK